VYCRHKKKNDLVFGGVLGQVSLFKDLISSLTICSGLGVPRRTSDYLRQMSKHLVSRPRTEG
jgi:hypothetical protein